MRLAQTTESVLADDRTKGDGFHTQKREGFRVVQTRKDELLAMDRSQREEKSQVSEMQHPHSNGDACPKHLQVVSTRNGRSRSASSSWSDGKITCWRTDPALCAKDTELLDVRDNVQMMENVSPAGVEGKLDEDFKTEVDGGADSRRKNWRMRTKIFQSWFQGEPEGKVAARIIADGKTAA